MTYVDGFLLPIAADRIEEYRRLAELAAQVWKEYGALDYKECVLDDDRIAHLRAFADTAGAREGETVIIAFITYASKADRGAINEKVMADPRMAAITSEQVPFDDKRMAFAGFQTLVEW